jgi:hypothetical protein
MSGIILLVIRILLAVTLYGFLGVVLYTLWKDVKRQGEILVRSQPVPITLATLLEGPPLSKHYTCAEIILGRDDACDFAINDQTVSSRHARLSYRQNQWWLEDLASTNGTLLNGESVSSPVVLTTGDELHLGQVGVKIEIG